MKLEKICGVLDASLLHGEFDPEIEIFGGYAGDLLSHVMGRLSDGDAWLTVMSNVNTVAVAVLADAACIILCEGAPFDDDAIDRAKKQRMPVLRTEYTIFEAAVKLDSILQRDADPSRSAAH